MPSTTDTPLTPEIEELISDMTNLMRKVSPTAGALMEVSVERGAQDLKWGAQNHPDVAYDAPIEAVAYLLGIPTADTARDNCEATFKAGRPSWSHVLVEEVCEAIEAGCESDPTHLREELVQCAAVCVAWIEAIDRRAA